MDEPDRQLLAPDPADVPQPYATWPPAARRRLALAALLDRTEQLTATGSVVHVLVPDPAGRTWRGLGSLLACLGVPADVLPADGLPTDGPVGEPVPLPADPALARTGRHGAALLGPDGTGPVRHLGITIAGEPTVTGGAEGPWQVLTDEGWRTTLTADLLLDPLLELRPGQRLQAMVTAGVPARLVSAWH